MTISKMFIKFQTVSFSLNNMFRKPPDPLKIYSYKPLHLCQIVLKGSNLIYILSFSPLPLRYFIK